MQYSHTQRGPLSWILAVIGLAGLIAAVANSGDWRIALPAGIFGGVMVVLSLCFGTLTTEDVGDALKVSFGPVPLFFKRVPYHSITSAEPATSRLIDGWGIHYVPGRGWIYNLWGWDCVRLDVDGRPIRIGSDDADNLAAFIQSKLAQSAG